MNKAHADRQLYFLSCRLSYIPAGPHTFPHTGHRTLQQCCFGSKYITCPLVPYAASCPFWFGRDIVIRSTAWLCTASLCCTGVL